MVGKPEVIRFIRHAARWQSESSPPTSYCSSWISPSVLLISHPSGVRTRFAPRREAFRAAFICAPSMGVRAF